MKKRLQPALMVALTLSAHIGTQAQQTTENLLIYAHGENSDNAANLDNHAHERLATDEIQQKNTERQLPSLTTPQDISQPDELPSSLQPDAEYQMPHGEEWRLTVIPVRKPLQRYEPLWKRSPFVIATPPTNSPVQENSQYTLSSIIKVGEDYYAHVIETATQRRLPVSKKPNPEHGLVLLDVSEDIMPSKTTVKISVRGTPMTISFDTGAFALPSGSTAVGFQNMNPYMPNPQPFPGMQTPALPLQQTNQQQINQQQMNQHQLMQQQLIQQQSRSMPQGSFVPSTPNTPSAITPPEVTTTRRIIRRRVFPEGGAPMDIPPNTLVNPPPPQ